MFRTAGQLPVNQVSIGRSNLSEDSFGENILDTGDGGGGALTVQFSIEKRICGY